jgi:hypothetical protein
VQVPGPHRRQPGRAIPPRQIVAVQDDPHTVRLNRGHLGTVGGQRGAKAVRVEQRTIAFLPNARNESDMIMIDRQAVSNSRKGSAVRRGTAYFSWVGDRSKAPKDLPA